jgi:vacuolar-type H+-ATPase subunit I/STV1
MSALSDLSLGGVVNVMLGLFIFGLGYNWAVSRLGRKLEGYMSLVVAMGVMVTLVGVLLLSPGAALICVLAFAATGLPMIFGSIVRYITRRESSRSAIIDEVEHDD